jgi:FkbM family methyltransferase
MKTIEFRNQEINFNQREDFWRTVESGGWEPCSFTLLEKHIERDKIFVDIGAWNGVLSVFASKLGAKCYSIEPDPRAFEELCENIELNKPNNIFPEYLAISDKKGVNYLNSMPGSEFGNSESSLLERGAVGMKSEIVTETLKGFIKTEHIKMKDVCLIKIDTEGGEVAIIEETKEFLAQHKPKIYISFHPFWFPDMEKDISRFIEILFPIYHITNVSTEEILTPKLFRESLVRLNEHSFLLIPKN